jgi:aldehyde:ferredoxin oxidoreductase
MYSPQLVTLDLTEDKVIPKKKIDSRVVEKFLGGRGIGVYLGYETIPVDTSPLGLENNIIFGTGGLTGSIIPSSGTASATFKSPHTNTLCTSIVTGNLGAYLRRSISDFFLIQGKAKSPKYILIDEFSDITLENAKDIWLKSTQKTDMILREKYGEESCITCIGEAAVNKVIYAGAVVNNSHIFQRGGLGTILASKNIKAIVLTESPKAISLDGIDEELITKFNSFLQDHTWSKQLTSQGTFTIIESMIKAAVLSTKNCSRKLKVDYERIKSFTGYEKPFDCWYCPVKCVRNSFQNFLSLGPNLRILDQNEIQKAIEKCDQEGLDPISTGAALASLFHIQEDKRKLLNTQMGFQLGHPRIYSLIDDIVHKKGLGDQLSRGEDYLYLQTSEPSPMIKGQMPGMYYYPNCPGLSMDLSTSSYGGSNFQGEGILFPEILGYPYQLSPHRRFGKVKMKILLENLIAVLDSLIICSRYLPLFLNSNSLVQKVPSTILSLLIHYTPMKILSSLIANRDYLSSLVLTIINSDISIDNILDIGNRITLLERLYRTRAGITASSDKFSRYISSRPDFFKNQKSLISAYYQIKGLNQEGLVKLETLDKAGLVGLIRI